MINETISIYDSAGTLIAAPLTTTDAERVEELMASDYLQLAWQSNGGAPLPAGAYIMFRGEKMSLLDPYEPEQKDEAEWSYRPQFQSRVMGWQKIPFFHYSYGHDNTTITAREPDWTLTDTPANFMAAICKAIKNETGETWTYEVAVDLVGLSATLAFTVSDIYSGLNEVAGAFETEWRADKSTNTLYLGKAQFGEVIQLKVGDNVGVPSVTKSKTGYYNRFYVFGSTRNITQDYQGANVNNLVNKRLTLDKNDHPGGYIDTPRDAGTPVYPKVLTFDDIYPHSGLTVANLRPRLMYRLDEAQQKIQVGTDTQGEPVFDMYTIWYFQLPGFTLNDTTYSAENPDGMLIAGKPLSVHFRTGALTNREFELIYHSKAELLHNSDGLDFQVLAGDYEIKFVEESGLIIPMQTGIVPADGDEVILYNLRMPSEYITTAQEELEAVARKEIAESYTSDLNNYTVKSNPVAFAASDPGLEIGRKVLYVNGDYSYATRVIKLVTKLDNTVQQEITIGNEKIKGSSTTLKEQVVNANSNIDLLTQLNQLNQSVTQAYQRAQQMLLDNLAQGTSLWEIHPTLENTIIARFNVVAQGHILATKDVTAYAKGVLPGGDAPSSGVTELRCLDDVILTNPKAGHILKYDGQHWVNGTIDAGLDEAALAAYLQTNRYAKLSDIPSLADYATRSWVEGKSYATQSWVEDKGYATESWVVAQRYLTEHQDISHLLTRAEFEAMFERVDTDGGGWYIMAKSHLVSVGDVTAYGTGGPGSTLGGIGDVQLGSLAAGDVIKWDGQHWVNGPAPAGGVDESVLANYVTLDTEQEIRGHKRFTHNDTDFSYRITINGSFESDIHHHPQVMWHVSNRQWTKAVMDAAGDIHFLEGSVLSLESAHRGLVASKYVKFGGTASQVLMADGSVQTHWKAADVTTATSDDGMITPLAMRQWTTRTYVSALGVNGNYLTWTRNGVANNITVPYATDADTVDGLHSNGFARALPGGSTLSGDMNDMLSSRSFLGSIDATANTPAGNGWYNIVQVSHRNGESDGSSYVGQIALGMTLSHDNMYFRTHRTRAWQRLLTNNNYSSILDGRYLRLSGGTMDNTNIVTNLNADLLDGLHGGDYVGYRGLISSIGVLPATAGMYQIATAGWSGGVVVFNCYGSNSGLAFYRPGGSNSMPQILCALDSTNNWDNFGSIVTSRFGNAPSATKLQTARTLRTTSYNGYRASDGVSFDGTGDVTLKLPNSICASDWFRSYGASGWYNQNYDGGIYMIDSSWVRVYNNKGFYSGSGEIRSDARFNRMGYAGTLWNKGQGAYNVAVYNNANQTPLLLAYRDSAGSEATGADRLFAMELLNNGAELKFGFGGTTRFTFNSSGHLVASGDVTAYSDARLKSDVQTLRNRGFVTPRTYIKDGKRRIGFLAQEVQQLYPELVTDTGGADHWLALNYGNLVAVLEAQIIDHEERIKRLEDRA